MNKNDYARAKKILESFDKENLDPQIRDLVQGWLVSGDSEEEKEAALRDIFEEMVWLDKNPGPEAYEALAKSRKLLGFPQKPKRTNNAFVRRLVRISAAAASVAIVAGAGWLLLQNRIGDAVVVPDLATQTETAVRTGGDETKNITLPDGSEIKLGAESTIFFDTDNYLTDRAVRLEGDAYFRVAKMDGNTFTVNTGSIRVTVLGTEFRMDAHEKAATAEVMLATGKVSVSVAGIEDTTLAPGDHFVYDRKHRTIELHEIGEEELMRMRGMSLSFDESLDGLLRNIARQYGIAIKVEQGIELGNEVVLELKGNETIDDVMYILQKATNLFEHEIRQDTVFVYGRR